MEELLERASSRELGEWQAYERHAGPIDRSWDAETIASIHELLQSLNHILGAAHFTDKKNKKNPVREPSRWPRPYELSTWVPKE